MLPCYPESPTGTMLVVCDSRSAVSLTCFMSIVSTFDYFNAVAPAGHREPIAVLSSPPSVMRRACCVDVGW